MLNIDTYKNEKNILILENYKQKIQDKLLFFCKEAGRKTKNKIN
jgi:hypothetical protein